MNRKNNKQSNNSNTIPLALTDDGKMITIHDASEMYDANNDYGSNIKLTCPNCHSDVELCRKHVNKAANDEQQPSYWYFRHKKDTSVQCAGYGDKSSHMLAEQILRESIGSKMMLPSVFLRDIVPHESFITDSGNEKRVSYDEYDGIMSSLIPGFYNPDTNDTIYEYIDFSSVQYEEGYLMGCSEKLFNTDYVLKKNEEVVITDVSIEHSYPFGKTADAMITVKHDDGSMSEIAFEIRYAHKKTSNDVRIYADNKINVIECYIKDLPLDDDDIKDKLSKRLLGYDDKNKIYNEWLVNDYGADAFINEYNSYSFEWLIGSYILRYHNGEYAGLNECMGIDRNYYLTTTASDDIYMKKLKFNKNVYNHDQLPFSFFRNPSNHLMIINHPSVFINDYNIRQNLFIMISKTNTNNSGMSLNKIPDFIKTIRRITPYYNNQDKVDEYIAKPCYHDDDNYNWLTIIPYKCELCGKTMISWCNKDTPFTFIDYPPRSRKKKVLTFNMMMFIPLLGNIIIGFL